MTNIAVHRQPGPAASPKEIADRLLAGPLKIAITTHRNPDGDAIGSMLGMYRALIDAGHDVVMHHPDPSPVPDDFAFLLIDGEHVVSGPPNAEEKRLLLALDCASEGRIWTHHPPDHGVTEVWNADHHHDNTRFGDLNLIEPEASSSAEVVVHILDAAGILLTHDIARPLYVGLLTDTGRFCYANTGTEAHRIAALCISLGVDPQDIAQRLYEEQPAARLRLLGKAVDGVQIFCDGRVMLASLGPEDFHAAGGDDTEGIVEALRSIEGVEVAGLARRLGPKGWRMSLRSSTGDPDVSAIAREHGGGGHKSAAGFSSDLDIDDLFSRIVERLTEQFAGQH